MLFVLTRCDLSFQINSPTDVQESLRDGIILCRLMTVIEPSSIKSISNSKIPFKKMENINNFLDACEQIGVKKIDLFQTVDLYEGQNLSQVFAYFYL
jgi:Calponin